MEIELGPTDVSFVAGQRGTGKSVLADYLLRQYVNEGHKGFVYDTVRDHPDFKRVTPNNPSLEDFEEWARKLYKQGNIIVLIEEIDMICSSSLIGPEFKKLVSLGRHQNIGLILTARRIADVHKLPPSQAHHFFLFRMHLPNDVAYLRKFIGDDADQLSTLEDYHFMHWHQGHAQICEPVPLEGSR